MPTTAPLPLPRQLIPGPAARRTRRTLSLLFPTTTPGLRKPGKPGYAQQKRGLSHSMGGSNPAGKPLVHKHSRKRKFLLF